MLVELSAANEDEADGEDDVRRQANFNAEPPTAAYQPGREITRLVHTVQEMARFVEQVQYSLVVHHVTPQHLHPVF
jgi:hypothetical protein